MKGQNADAHSKTTAREILDDFRGESLHAWVTGFGTGGTLKGGQGAQAGGSVDDEVFDIVAVAAARAFFTKVLDGLGAQADVAYRELAPELREALTVGRPIAGDDERQERPSARPAAEA
ncbi:hypothetical protein M8009_00180 [Halomonas sp. ATCH28]|uniref:Uncharacterized protein n=1 Tax=Halomonas gemina TaxID=2945105 RepID=A0ABT0SW52_9GAMM|nr:hypothetical protein [Halomonas gemina]MCL7938722.1 hypothetical protein [Halomonas gemina]